jgi:fumarate reductase subunit D
MNTADQCEEMAEAAITTPVIILLMAVILNFGMLAYTAQADEMAARTYGPLPVVIPGSGRADSGSR